MALELLSDATYNEPLFWTPEAIHEFARSFHQTMLNFQADMSSAKAAGKVPEAELAAWRNLRDAWANWYGATTPTTWAWSSNVSVIEGYSNQLKVFYQKYEMWTGKKPSGAGVYEIDSPLSGLASPLLWVTLGLAGAVGLMVWLQGKQMIQVSLPGLRR